MRNIVMKISYDGTKYHGFQSQPNQVTIQQQIERALSELTGEKIKVIASGRTDAGVHARGQVINFLTSSNIETDRWCSALNSRLPDDIVALNACEMPLDFHARKSAKRKTYHYVINNHRHVDVLQRHVQYHHPVPLDIEEMKKAIPYLMGEHDFTSFCSVKSTQTSHVRTVYEARIEVEKSPLSTCTVPGNILRIIISGNGFLYHMVRIIAGTLIQIGQGKLNSSDMKRILDARDRTLAGPTAPPQGLILWEVLYDSLDL